MLQNSLTGSRPLKANSLLGPNSTWQFPFDFRRATEHLKVDCYFLVVPSIAISNRSDEKSLFVVFPPRPLLCEPTLDQQRVNHDDQIP
jgi:hypothetical protein